MRSTYEFGYTPLIPEPEEVMEVVGCDDEIYIPPEYPFPIPKVYLEGDQAALYQTYCFDWYSKSIIVIDDDILTKYTTYDGAKFIDHVPESIRDRLGFDIKQIDLKTLEKRTYKVILESTSKMDLEDFNELVDYIDPTIIKRISCKTEE